MSLEGKVISSALNDKQIHVLMQADISSLLTTHKDIWEFVKMYYEQNQVVPAPSVVLERFKDFDYYEDTGATKYHLDELRAEVLDDGIRSLLRQASGEVQAGKAEVALETISSKVSDLRRITATVRDLDVSNVDEAISYFESVKAQREAGVFGIYTGLAGFDNALPSGISPGQLGILLAYPAIGKSWLMLYFAVQAWFHGKTPLIISLEMTEAEVRNRIFTIIGQGIWSHRKLSGGYVEPADFKKWMAKVFNGMPPMYIISSEGLGEITPNVIGAKIDQYKPDIVFVDYMNLMSSNGKAESETVKMKHLSRESKLLAVQKQVPLVMISSATPDDITDMNSVPTLGQTAWSRQIAYDADWLLAMGREADSDVIECVFRKNRNGFLGEFYLNVDFDKGLFAYRGFDE